MRRRSYKPTREDRRIFEKVAETGNYNYFFEYYMGIELMPWQMYLHMSPAGDATVIGGVGSGKTIYKAVSELGHGIFSAKYKFMNLAPTAWQSQLMFNAMVDHIRDNPMERFLARDPVERPWPRIELTTGSSMEFRSASDIRLIQGWEGDSLNGDEFGILADGDEVISGMASRLRGRVSVGGHTRFRRGRLEVMTMPYMVQWLWTRYDAAKREQDFQERHNLAIAKGQPLHLLAAEDMVAMTVASASNVGLSEKDIARMRRRISDHLVDIQMGGARPMGLGEHFSMNMMRLYEDWGMNALMEEAIREKWKGYDEIVVPSIGPITWRIPRQKDHLYMVVGDPGSLDPPRRNSPIVAVWDVTDFPRGPARMVCFRWIFGRGSYDPFLQAFFEEYVRYRPHWALFDATGVQKSFDEIVFRQWGLMAEGVDLSGMKKAAGLTAAKILLGRGLLKGPFISGVRQQLTSYILPDTKIAQDIVSMFTVLGYKLREYLDTDAADTVGQDEEPEVATVSRNVRSAHSRARSGRRSPRQRAR